MAANVLHIDNINAMYRCNPKLYNDLVECAAFVNWRHVEKGLPAVLVLSFYRFI